MVAIKYTGLAAHEPLFFRDGAGESNFGVKPSALTHISVWLFVQVPDDLSFHDGRRRHRGNLKPLGRDSRELFTLLKKKKTKKMREKAKAMFGSSLGENPPCTAGIQRWKQVASAGKKKKHH